MEEWTLQIPGPHNGQPVMARGELLPHARGVIIAMHGRDMQAEDILKVTGKLDAPGFAVFAPQAFGRSWCPERFYFPLEKNEPWLSSSLAAIDWLVKRSLSSGFEREQIVLVGFSQGACLVLEYAARFPAPYGAVAGLAGALYGPMGTIRGKSDELRGTPVFLGCSDADPFIPKSYLYESAAVFQEMGAQVDLRIYPDLGHRVNLDEIHAVNAFLARIQSRGEPR